MNTYPAVRREVACSPNALRSGSSPPPYGYLILTADDLAAAYADALGSDGWHEGEFKRDFWYLNLVHFAEPIARPGELVDFVAERRTAKLADLLVAEIQISQWCHAGTGMLPITRACVTPSRA